MAKVLFLGGPWHDRYEDIREPLPHTLCVANPMEITIGYDDPDGPVLPDLDQTYYELRYVGQRFAGTPAHKISDRPVYVTCGYDGPPNP